MDCRAAVVVMVTLVPPKVASNGAARQGIFPCSVQQSRGSFLLLSNHAGTRLWCTGEQLQDARIFLLPTARIAIDSCYLSTHGI